jgi:uncharacterized repeat protein (TIGR02543 family)
MGRKQCVPFLRPRKTGTGKSRATFAIMKTQSSRACALLAILALAGTVAGTALAETNAATITVTLDPNGGAFSPADAVAGATFNNDGTLTLVRPPGDSYGELPVPVSPRPPPPTPAPTGSYDFSVFDGWWTLPDGTGALITPSSPVLAPGGGTSITLYAKWTQRTVVIYNTIPVYDTGAICAAALGFAGLAIAPDGTLFNTYGASVRQIIPSGTGGVFFTLAGQAAFPGSADGIGAAARFCGALQGDVFTLTGSGIVATYPTQVGDNVALLGGAGFGGAALAGGGLIVADSRGPDSAGNGPDAGDGTILRRIDLASREVTTLTGAVGVAGSNNMSVSFLGDPDMPFTVSGYVAVNIAASADGRAIYATGSNCVLKITLAGAATTATVTTLAGQTGFSGTENGRGTLARFGDTLGGIAVSPATGDIYVTERRDNAGAGRHGVVRKITPDGVVTTLGGTLAHFGSDCVFTGPGGLIVNRAASGMAVDDAGGLLYVATGQAILACDLLNGGGAFVRVAGADGEHGFRDGPASEARFNGLQGFALAANGDLYIADTGNNAIRKLSPGGMVTTLHLTATTAGAGGTGTGDIGNTGSGGGGGAPTAPALSLLAALLATRALRARKKV